MRNGADAKQKSHGAKSVHVCSTCITSNSPKHEAPWPLHAFVAFFFWSLPFLGESCFAMLCLGAYRHCHGEARAFSSSSSGPGRVARELRNLGTFPSAERKTWATRAARVRHMCTEHLKRCESFLKSPPTGYQTPGVRPILFLRGPMDRRTGLR